MQVALNLGLLLLLLLLPPSPLASSGTATATSSPISVSRATAALDSLLSTYWSNVNQYLMEEPPAKIGPIRESELSYWNYQEAIHAVALGAELIDPAKYGPWVNKMVAAQQAQGGRQAGTGADGWGRQYYDDMNWAVLGLLAAHEADPLNPLLLVTARDIFTTIWEAWDTTTCGGGVWWNAQHGQKATASNAGPALAAVLLSDALDRQHQQPDRGGPVVPVLPNSTAYRSWATKVYRFWNRTMTDPATGAVTDHYNVSIEWSQCGKVIEGPFSCKYKTKLSVACVDCLSDRLCIVLSDNEGLMLGAATVLGHAADAGRFASHLVMNQTVGTVLFDGCETSCKCCDCQSFKGIAIRELARWLRSPISHDGTVDPQLRV